MRQGSQLVNLPKKITDYNAEDESMVDPDVEKKDAEIDEEVGVAVVFDEEEQADEEGFEIAEESDEEEEVQEAAPEGTNARREMRLGYARGEAFFVWCVSVHHF